MPLYLRNLAQQMRRKAENGEALWALLDNMILRLVRSSMQIFILMFAIANYRLPESPVVITVASISLTLGILMILFSVLIAPGRARARVAFYGLFALICIQSATGFFGDMIVTHPKDALVITVSLLLTWAVGTGCHYGRRVTPDSGRHASQIPASTFVLYGRKATQRDREFIAAHEAGHVLMYGAWERFPDNLNVVVKDHADNSDSLGCVSGGERPHLLMEKGFAEWDMLLSLAGSAGERSYTGHETLGAVSDSERWLAVASLYLKNFSRGVFFSAPASPTEMAHNAQQLALLREAQMALLQDFFVLNHDVHTRLTEVLLGAGSLSGEALSPWLSAVRLPENFPVPFGHTPVP